MASNHSILKGVDAVRNNLVNNGTSFTCGDRTSKGLVGLLPTVPLTLEQNARLSMQNLDAIQDSLQKYLYLMKIEASNNRLFYYLVQKNVEKILPLIYTPTVGLACQNFSQVYGDFCRGLFLSIQDADNLDDIFARWPYHKDVKAICVTDGERILGLGDLGIFGMGIPIGKLAIYTAVGGVRPEFCLPITLDVGTNTQKYLDSEFYFGLKQKRVVGDEYLAFLDKFMNSVTKNFGKETLIQFEDFGNHNAFVLLERYREKFTTFNDDIQGTACVTLAAFISAAKKLGSKLSDQTFVFVGAGEANIGIAELTAEYIHQNEGLSYDEAKNLIWLVDSKGLITATRGTGMNAEKQKFAHPSKLGEIAQLDEIVAQLKPSFLIGASGQGQIFTDKILKTMAANHCTPVIFALSNPTSKAECTAEEAIQATEGRCIFASGSPFAPVKLPNSDQLYHTTQCNNAYVFPGLGLGIVLAKPTKVPTSFFLAASKGLADMTSVEDYAQGRLFAPASRLHDISARIATITMATSNAESLTTASDVTKCEADQCALLALARQNQYIA